jgi:hypothetical protein
VFAVGRRVYVGRVTLTDETGKTERDSLKDGTEVAILGWRPGSGDSTQYHVRATESGVEGWVRVGGLRATALAEGATEPVQPSGRGFGRR